MEETGIEVEAEVKGEAEAEAEVKDEAKAEGLKGLDIKPH